MDDTINFLTQRMSEVETETPIENSDITTQQNVSEISNNEVISEIQENETIENTVENSQPQLNSESNTSKEEVKETTKKVFANEQVAELNNFLTKNPEATLADYQKLKRPNSELSEEELLKEYYSGQGNLTDKEIALKLKKLETKAKGEDDDFDFDFDELDEEKNLEIEALRERELLDARAWREAEVKNKLDFTDLLAETTEAAPTVENNNQSISEYEAQLQKQYEERTTDYYAKTFQALNEITDLEMNISGERVGFTLDDASKKIIQNGLDVSKVVEKFYAEEGVLNDAKGFISELAWFIPELRDQMLEYRDEQVRVRTINEQARVRKNIQVDNQVNVSGNNSTQERDAADAWLKQHYSQRL